MMDVNRKDRETMSRSVLSYAMLIAITHALKLQPLSRALRRRELLGASIALTVAPFAACAKGQTIQLGGYAFTPAAMLVQMAEQTASMEGIMRQSAKEMETMTLQQRDEAGATNQGPGVIGRGDMIKSVDVMITNSKLETLPNGEETAMTLRAIQFTAKLGKGPLERDEYLIMARQYAAAREEMRRGFESLTPEEQAEGKAFAREIRARDEARMKEMQQEEERVKLARARIAEENARRGATTELPRKKTLKELEELQQATFGKQPPPMISLYGQ